MIASKKPGKFVFSAFCGIVMLFSGLCTAVLAQDSTHRINTWAPNIPGKALKVLFILPQHAQGDIATLADQIEMEWEAVYLWDRDHLGYDPQQPMPQYPDASEKAVRKALEKALKKKWDVIVLANLNPAVLPESAQQRCLSHVKKGGGLVSAFLKTDDSPGFLRALNAGTRHPAAMGIHGVLPVDDWGNFDIEQFVEWRSLEEGRIVHLHFRGDTPKTHGWVPRRSQYYPGDAAYLENAQALMAKVLLIAANRQPAFRIQDVLYQAPATPREEDRPAELESILPENFQKAESAIKPRSYRLQLAEPLNKACNVRVRVRALNSEARVEYNFKDPLPARSTTYSFNIILPSGRHWIDVFLYREEEILDWYSLEENTYSWPALRQVSLSKSVVRPNDSVTVTLSLSPSAASASQPSRVYIKALDTLTRLDGGHGRVLAENMATVPPGQQRIDLRLRFADLIGPVIRLECFTEGGALDPKNPRVATALPQWTSFLTVAHPLTVDQPYLSAMMPEGTEYQARHWMALLHAYGLDALQGADDAEEGMLTGAAGLNHIPLAAQYATRHGGAGFKRMPCVNDTEYRRIEKDRLQDVRLDLEAGNQLGYSLGNGFCLTESDENLCHAETCQQAYRSWLGKNSATLPINFKVSPPFHSLQEAVQQEALPAWFLYRRFMEESFLDLLVAARDILQSEGSKIRVGGKSLDQPAPYAGYAWPEMIRSLDLLSLPAETLQIARLRSYQQLADAHALFIPNEERRQSAMQSDEAASASGHWLTHTAMLNQIRGVYLGNAFGTIPSHTEESILLPDSSPTPFAGAALEAMQWWKQGRAAVLRLAKRHPAQIAVYDHPYAAWLPYLDPALGGDSSERFLQWLDTLGYANDLVDRKVLLDTGLGAYRVLILPNAIVLDDQEINAIRRFVQQGGFLLADRLPGKWGAWGVPQNTSPLAALFGLRWKAAAAAQQITGIHAEESKKPLTMPGYCDTVVLSSRGTSLAMGVTPDGESTLPLWLKMPSETGHGMLLNHDIPSVAATNQHQWFQARLCQYLGEAGCTPIITLENDLDTLFRGTRFAYGYGEAEIWALLAAPDRSMGIQKVSLRFPKDRQIYDMQSGNSLRGGNKLSLKLAPGELALFSLLPQPAAAMKLIVPDSIQPGRRLPLLVELASGASENSPGGVWFSLHAVDTPPLPHFSRFAPFIEGRAATFFPMAANEQEGAYLLSLVNPLTGETRQQLLGNAAFKYKKSFK